MTTTLELALAPALKAYGAELEAHQRDWTTEWPSCRCGYAKSARSVGMHVAAAHRRAEKVYAEAAAQVVENLTRFTPSAPTSYAEARTQHAMTHGVGPRWTA